MKKLLFGLLLIVCLSSCEEGFRTQKVDENSQVPITYSDSTRWKSAKVYIVDDHVMYVRIEKDTYKVNETGKTAQLLVIILIIILFIILFAATIY